MGPQLGVGGGYATGGGRWVHNWGVGGAFLNEEQGFMSDQQMSTYAGKQKTTAGMTTTLSNVESSPGLGISQDTALMILYMKPRFCNQQFR